MTQPFNGDKNTVYNAATTSDFEITRHIGGSKSADLSSEPRSEADRALLESRRLIEQLRRALPTP